MDNEMNNEVDNGMDNKVDNEIDNEEENVPETYGPRDGNQSLFNNPKMSDVSFSVGGQTVYGHKLVLGLGSPVFESMFFGELKEQQEVIEIKDLTSDGFKNALRFIYGSEIDFELSELYESYVAADKYLLHEFNKEFFDYIKGKLDAKSSCLIYDQLMKIGDREEIPLADVRTVIIQNSKEAFESEHFTQIDQETLISLLSLDELSIAEFDLFMAVSNWVDCEVERQGLSVNGLNRWRVFLPIKGYILFTALTLEQIANGKFYLPLTNKEKGLLVMHRLNKENLSPIELKTSRKAAASACSVFISESGSVEYHSYSHSRAMYLSVNRMLRIETFYTTYSGSAANLSFKIRDAREVELKLKPQITLQDGKWSFSFKPPFRAEPDCLYTLVITGDDQLADENQLMKEQTFEVPKYSIVVNMGPNSQHPEYSGHHFVKKITYFP